MAHIHNHDHDIHNKNISLNKTATFCSVITASIIILAKIIGWYLTESLTILASLADSLLDIGTSIINFIAVRYALIPADENHRFGHDKAEDLAVFAQSTFFILSGLFVITQAIKRIFQPEPIEYIDVGIVIMAFSMVMTFFLLLFQRHVIKKTNSNIVKADYLHYFVDLFSNFAVIISLLISSYFNFPLVDPIFAILIAVYIFHGAFKLLRKAFKNLMDEEFDEKEKELLRNIVFSHPEAKDIRDLKTRYAGSKAFIQFHLDLDKDMSLIDADRVVDEIEEAITKAFKNVDIIIHQHPYGIAHGSNK